MGGFLNYLAQFARDPKLNPAKANERETGTVPDQSLGALLPGAQMPAGGGLNVETPEAVGYRQQNSLIHQLLGQMLNRDHPENIQRMMRQVDQSPVMAGDPGGPVSKAVGVVKSLPKTTKITQRASDAFTRVTDANREQILSAALQAAEEFGGLNRELLQRRLGLYAHDADGIIDNLIKSQRLGPPSPGLGGLAPMNVGEEAYQGLAEKILDTLTRLRSGKIGRLPQEPPAINRGVDFQTLDRGATLQTPVAKDLGLTMNKETGRTQLLGPAAQKISELDDPKRLSLILQKELSGIPLTREDQIFLAARKAKP